MAANVLISTSSTPLALAYASNDTTAGTSITQPTDTLTEPTGDGVFDTGHGGLFCPNGLLILPFGVGSATTFLLGVYAWDVIPGVAPSSKDQWTAWPLATFTCTLSTLTGVAGGRVAATNFYCGTIALGVGNANVSNEIVSPTGNVKASILVDVKGCRKVQLKFAMNSSSTSANALVRKL